MNIAPLTLSSPAERALYARGEENYKSKKALKSSNIMQKAPDAEESSLIHKMWTDGLAYADAKNPAKQPANSVAMSKTVIHSTQIMQPQNRNRHHFSKYTRKLDSGRRSTCDSRNNICRHCPPIHSRYPGLLSTQPGHANQGQWSSEVFC